MKDIHDARSTSYLFSFMVMLIGQQALDLVFDRYKFKQKWQIRGGGQDLQAWYKEMAEDAIRSLTTLGV